MIFWSVRLHKIKTERLRPYKEEAGSPLKASGSFAQYHFQLYYINTEFFFTLWAIKWKFNKNRIRIYLGFRFATAYGAMHPMCCTTLFFVFFHGKHLLTEKPPEHSSINEQAKDTQMFPYLQRDGAVRVTLASAGTNTMEDSVNLQRQYALLYCSESTSSLYLLLSNCHRSISCSLCSRS